MTVIVPKFPARLRRPGYALAAVALLLVAGVVATIAATGRDNAKADPPSGVPAEYAGMLVEAAASCPALTPARLAGQIMAESQFSPTATNGRQGRGLAGLTEADWNTWRPSAQADRLDPAANITALAHMMCDLLGHVRVAQLAGDPWQLALGAFYSGLAAVTAAGGVPEAAKDYVVQVVGFAAWFSLTPGFGPSNAPTDIALPAVTTPPATPTPSPTSALSPSPNLVAATTTTRGPTTTTTTRAAPPPPPPDPGPLTAGALINNEYHGCLSADRALDGTHLRIAGCDGSLVQRWEPRSDGTIRSSGLCMDAANAGTADFTPVQVAYCSGNPAQLFTLRDQHVYSPYANRCVNIHFDNGPIIVLFSCLNQSNQWFQFTRQ